MEKCKFLSSFAHCPKCGGQFVDNNTKSKRCAECGFVYYFNPSAAVAAIIKNEKGEILISTRRNDPAKGKNDLPGGFLDSYETAEECVCREVMEECHLTVKEVKYLFSHPNLYNYSNFEVHTLDLFFECTVNTLDNILADDDVEKLEFIAPQNIDTSKFGFASIRKGMEQYLAALG